MEVLYIVLALAQIVTLHFTSKELDKLKARVKALEPQEKENNESCGL